jgi:acetyl esterase/lipase
MRMGLPSPKTVCSLLSTRLYERVRMPIYQYSPGTSPPLALFRGKLIRRIHGGSFYAGSASAPGLSGARIAQEGNIIVVVLQYRLGVLGYLPPSSASSAKDPNLGVGDIILALKWIRDTIKDFGGDGEKVVLGGQSTGAHMIRGTS